VARIVKSTAQWLAAALVGTLILSSVVAQAPLGPKPACPPGCKIVEETVLKEQPRFCCEVVPKTKKKWVHETIEDGFCIPHSPLHQRGCDKVPHCRACTRKLLVKKEVEVCDGYKCQVKKTMETVAYKVYRVVPCGAAPVLDGPGSQNEQQNGAMMSPLADRARLLPYFMLDRLPVAAPRVPKGVQAP
jgi:hypothetical protein